MFADFDDETMGEDAYEEDDVQEIYDSGKDLKAKVSLNMEGAT